jgi:chaperone modulatory protein CbpM
MNTQATESIWLNDTDVCRIEHLAELSGLSIEEIEDLVESGVIETADDSTQAAPTDDRKQQRRFQLQYVVTVKTARRLRDDFQLDRHGVALALALLRRIGELEAEVHAIEAKSGHSA